MRAESCDWSQAGGVASRLSAVQVAWRQPRVPPVCLCTAYTVFHRHYGMVIISVQALNSTAVYCFCTLNTLITQRHRLSICDVSGSFELSQGACTAAVQLFRRCLG